MIQDIAPHHLYNQFSTGHWPSPGSIVFCVRDGLVLVRQGAKKELRFPAYEDIAEKIPAEFAGNARQDPELPRKAGADDRDAKLVWLFTLDESDCFWYRGDEPIPELDGYSFLSLRELRKAGYGPKHLFFAAYTAMQLIGWYRDNAYCGRCGGKTEHSETERALVCPGCGRTIYPRIIPAVIVGVLDKDPVNRANDRIVLTKYAGREIPYFALIAGFTEIGETLEETVQREVMEEVGLKVKNVRYYKSQPWAMADDILMGFYCEVEGDRTIRLDQSELKEGGWYTREEVVLQPDDYSLTNEMMTRFKEGLE